MTTLFNEENSGSPFAQWAKGAAWAKGKYLWIAESDDYCDTDMLALHVQSMEANENAVIAYSHSHLVDENGQFLRDFKDDYAFIFGDTAKWAKDFTNEGKTEVAKHMVFSNTIPNASGILMRKEAFDKVGAPATHWRLKWRLALLRQAFTIRRSRLSCAAAKQIPLSFTNTTQPRHQLLQRF